MLYFYFTLVLTTNSLTNPNFFFYTQSFVWGVKLWKTMKLKLWTWTLYMTGLEKSERDFLWLSLHSNFVLQENTCICRKLISTTKTAYCLSPKKLYFFLYKKFLWSLFVLIWLLPIVLFSIHQWAGSFLVSLLFMVIYFYFFFVYSEY